MKNNSVFDIPFFYDFPRGEIIFIKGKGYGAPSKVANCWISKRDMYPSGFNTMLPGVCVIPSVVFAHIPTTREGVYRTLKNGSRSATVVEGARKRAEKAGEDKLPVSRCFPVKISSIQAFNEQSPNVAASAVDGKSVSRWSGFSAKNPVLINLYNKGRQGKNCREKMYNLSETKHRHDNANELTTRCTGVLQTTNDGAHSTPFESETPPNSTPAPSTTSPTSEEVQRLSEALEIAILKLRVKELEVGEDTRIGQKKRGATGPPSGGDTSSRVDDAPGKKRAAPEAPGGVEKKKKIYSEEMRVQYELKATSLREMNVLFNKLASDEIGGTDESFGRGSLNYKIRRGTKKPTALFVDDVRAKLCEADSTVCENFYNLFRTERQVRGFCLERKDFFEWKVWKQTDV